MKNPYMPEKAIITKITKETKDTFTFRVKYKCNHMPGQFVNVSVLGIGECPISFASYSNDYIDLTIRNVGNVTKAIHEKKVGDYLWIRGPYGHGYPMETFHGKDIVLIGGGTGVAPLIGAVDYIEKNISKFKSVTLLFGFRNDESILFRTNYKRWVKLFNFDITLDCKTKIEKAIKSNKFTKSSDKVIYKSGLITNLIVEHDLKKDSIAIVCGPPIMIKFVVQSLLEKGFSEDNIYISFERLMSCGLGKCGHCEVGGKYICKHGPVFTYKDSKDRLD